ncbi:MAG: phosphohydrolase [bacterium]|nr:phosphohydrolase [bacterium]
MANCGCREAGCHHLNLEDRRIGAWLETISGVRFYPADPRSDEVRIEDIAHALSRQCRFGGHVRDHYSVAQHSVLVSLNVPPHDALAALLHDAAEAYVVDLPSPVKWILRDAAKAGGVPCWYDQIEARTWEAISERFGVSNVLPKSVKVADMRALFTERRDLRPLTAALWEDQEEYPPFDEPLRAMGCEEARVAFLARFSALGGMS